MSNEELNLCLTSVVNKLKASGVEAECWHAGGGIYGVMVWLKDGKSLLWAPVDGKWSYELDEADGGLITGGVSNLDESNFDKNLLVEEIFKGINAFG